VYIEISQNIWSWKFGLTSWTPIGRHVCDPWLTLFAYRSDPDAVPVTGGGGETSYWPSPSVLTARLRRLITASQRYTKSRQILQIHQTQSPSQSITTMSAPLCPLPPSFNDALNPKMVAKIERQQRFGK